MWLESVYAFTLHSQLHNDQDLAETLDAIRIGQAHF